MGSGASISQAPDGYEIVRLYDEEVKRYATHPGIVTISYFSGTANAAGMGTALGTVTNHIKTRLLEVLQANPWLCGTLDTKQALLYPKEVSESHLNDILITPTSMMSNLTRDKSYSEINKGACDLCEVGDAATLLKTKRMVCKACIVPVNDSEVAFIFCISHYIADGYTYYKILNMLSAGKNVEVMTPRRKEQDSYTYNEKLILGEAMAKYQNSMSIAKHFIYDNVTAKTPYDGYMVNYIDEAKVNVEREKHDDHNHSVSTNDVLLSQVSNVCKPRLMMHAINLRRRSDKFNNDDAGNYENIMVYDDIGYDNPMDIRRSLSCRLPYYQMSPKPLPSFFEKTSFAFMSSWCFHWFKTLKIEGCESLLHLPVLKMQYDKSDYLHSPMDLFITFQATPEKRAMLIVNRRASKDDYKMGVALGDAILE